MRTKILVFATVALSGLFLCLWYFLVYLKDDNKVTNLIPNTSLGVIAVDNLSATINNYKAYQWWDEVSSLPFIETLVNASGKVDSLINAGILQTKINSKPLFISFHVTANSKIEPLFFIGSQDFDWVPANIESLSNLWFDNMEPLSTRLFNDQTIFESNGNALKWGFIISNGFLVISPNSVLLEDVIRTEDGNDFRLFKEDQGPIIEGSGLTVVVNSERLDRFRAVLTGAQNLAADKAIDGLLTFRILTDESGFTFSGIGENGLGYVAQLPPNSTIKAENFIPSTATSVSWFGLSTKGATELTNFNVANFVALQNDQVCEIQLDLGGNSMTKVLLTEPSDLQETADFLSELSSANRAASDTLFVENYMNSEIRFINKSDFFEKVFGGSFKSMGKPYYAIFNNVLLMSDKIDGIKAVLGDYEAENTWGRIPVKRRYIDNLIREANITRINNFEYALDPLLNSFNPKWKQFFKDNDRLFSAFENFSYQVNANSNTLLVSAQLTFTDVINTSRQTEVNAIDNDQLALITNVYGDTSLTTKPFVVKNHNNNEQEFIFQDLSNSLYLADRNGNVLWKKPLGSKINGNIEQVDFYSNRKLQYLIMTDSAIHLIDRNGDEVDGFPKPLNTELPINKFSVIDYDNSKNYRYATTDRRGNVYLLDKNGEQLEGWMPKAMGSPLLAAPEHLRIRGRDCIIIIQSNGLINLTTRKGEDYPGFPINLTKRLSGDYYIKQGPSFAESNLQLITEDGELVTIDFNGVIKNRNQLLKPSVQSKFIGVRDKLGTGLLVVRKDIDRVAFFDEKGQKKFEKEISTNENLIFEYYNFRNDSELYVIQDFESRDLLILDDQGKDKLNKKAFTKNPIGIFYYQNKREYELLANFDNQMAIYSFAK